MDKKIYITINHLDDFESQMFLKPGDVLALKKDKKNTYDDDDLYIDDDPKRGFQSWFRRGRRKKGKAPKVNNTDDYYEVLD